ncbi:unnamed protein product [Ceutorhynchus assimilis]|uniref:Uncharacterized protein n=1 Tax=Ceutorhynchus assimilis TaxID=467358 RepID=A0A9N9MF93_9CUCU|nr:unnamed protein product [Ceutorhynchus assimilis]
MCFVPAEPKYHFSCYRKDTRIDSSAKSSEIAQTTLEEQEFQKYASVEQAAFKQWNLRSEVSHEKNLRRKLENLYSSKIHFVSNDSGHLLMLPNSMPRDDLVRMNDQLSAKVKAIETCSDKNMITAACLIRNEILQLESGNVWPPTPEDLSEFQLPKNTHLFLQSLLRGDNRIQHSSRVRVRELKAKFGHWVKTRVKILLMLSRRESLKLRSIFCSHFPLNPSLDAGLSDLLVEAGVAAEGSLSSIITGKHYNRAVRTHKVVFEAMMRIIWKSFLPWLEETDTVVSKDLEDLKKELSYLYISNEDTQGSSGITKFSKQPAGVARYCLTSDMKAAFLHMLRNETGGISSKHVFHNDLSPAIILKDERHVSSIMNLLTNKWINPFVNLDIVNISTGSLPTANITKDLLEAHAIGAIFKRYFEIKNN